MQTHSTTTTVANAGEREGLSYGTEIVRCPICQTALVADECCPHGCRLDHRGRRQSPCRGLAYIGASNAWSEDAFESSSLEALALAGELRGELVA